MKKIKIIKEMVSKDKYRFTRHAIEQSILRKIDVEEVKEAILNDEIIEDYPSDKYSPSCLVYGQTDRGRHLHIQCSLPPKIKIITIYEPKPNKWTNYRIRR